MKKIIFGLVAAMTAFGLQAEGRFKVSGGPFTYNGGTYESVAQAHAELSDEFPEEYTKFQTVMDKLSDEAVTGTMTFTLLEDYVDPQDDANDCLSLYCPGGANYVFDGNGFTVSAVREFWGNEYQVVSGTGVTLTLLPGSKFTMKPGSEFLPKGCGVKKEGDLWVVREGVYEDYLMRLTCNVPGQGSIDEKLNSISELMSFIAMYSSYLQHVTDLTLTLGQDVTITDTAFNFPGGNWKFVGGEHKVTGTVEGKQFVLSGSASVTFDSGIFQADPREVGTVLADRFVKQAGGFYTVSDDPAPVVALTVDEAVIREAIARDPACDTIAYTLEIGVDTTKGYDDYKNLRVFVYLSNSLPVEVGTAAVGIKAGGNWLPEDTSVEGDPSERTLIPGVSLQQAVESYGGKVSFVYKDISGALMATGNTFTLRAVVKPALGSTYFSEQKQYTFKHGYFGPAAEGEPLPVTGKDVLGYFTFDDESNRGKNAGVTASSISDLGTATIAAGRFNGSAIYLKDTDVRVTGTLVTGVEGRALPELPVSIERPPQDNAHRLAGDKAWSVAFWFKPDPSVKPANWDAIGGALDPEWKGLFDGAWHHIAVTFNARRWIESSCPFEIYCDGGHWTGDTMMKTDKGWTYSWHGYKSQLKLPMTIDPTTGEFAIGGQIVMVASGIEVSIPFIGAVDDFVVFTRWLAPDDVHCLYETGDAYVTHIFPDVIGEGGLNVYKSWTGLDEKRGGQLFMDNALRGTFDSNFGWSTYFNENSHWQFGAARACDDSAASETDLERTYGYNTSFCDCLVAHNGELIAQCTFSSNVFPNASLTLGRIGGNSGALYLYTGAAGGTSRTVNDLRLNNGYIKADSAKEMTLDGSMTVNAPAAAPFKIIPDSTTAQKLVVEASIVGEANAGLTIGQGNENDELTVMLSGDASAFKGTLDVTAGATLELPVEGESVGALTPYDGTQMKALAGEGWVKFVLADDVQLVEGTNLLAQLPKDAGIAARFTTNLEGNEDFEVSVEVVEEAAETQVFLVVKEAESPTPPTPEEKPMVAEVFGGELVEGEGSTNCTLVVTDPDEGYTAKWAWSDTDECTNDAARVYSEAGVYTNIVKVTAEGYYDFYGTGVVTIVSAPPPPPVEPVTPGEEHQCETPQEAADLVQAINADKVNRIKVPTCVKGDDIAIYLGYLKARVLDETKVVVDLDPDLEAALKAALDAAFTAESVAELSDDAATLTIEEAIPGLYYWVEGGVEPNVIDQNGEAQQAESEKTTLNLAKPDLGVTTKGFFKLAVGVAAPPVSE